jgi:hypothetical protein
MPSIIPSIPIDLDRRRYLRLTNWAKCQAERALCDYWGKEMSLYDALIRSPMRANDLAIMFWQALLEDDPSLTLHEATNLMDYATTEVVMNAVVQAWNISTPADTPAEQGSHGADPFGSASGVSTGLPSGAIAAQS